VLIRVEHFVALLESDLAPFVDTFLHFGRNHRRGRHGQASSSCAPHQVGHMAVVLGGANIVKMPVDKLFHGASIQPRQNLLVICGLSCLSIRLPRRDLVRKRLLGATSGLYTARGSGTRWGLGLDVRLHVRALRAMHGPVKTFSDLAACDMGSGAAERSGGVLVPTGTQHEVRLEWRTGP